MAKFHTTLCALGAISFTAALAQNPVAPAAPPITPSVPAAPAGGPADGGAIAPAPIDPPITFPAVPPPPVPPPGTATELNAPGESLALSPTASRLNEFQGDDISLVLRTLARQAEMNIVVSDKVAAAAGTITMRIQDKTPREAIEVIVASKGLVMDELNGVFFVKTQEERAKEPTISGSYTFNYAAAKDIAPLLQSQLASAAAPQIDTRTNTIFYRETKSNLENIQTFLETVDSPTKQVMIEARLVEVNANPKQSYGINWAGTVGGFSNPQTFRYGGALPDSLGTPSQGPLTNTLIRDSGNSGVADFLLNGQTTGGFGDTLQNQFAILSIPQMSATLRFLNEDNDAEFLANPRIVTANNQKAEIKIVRAQPVPQLNFNEQTAQAVFSGFQDKEFGNTLIVTPSINADNYINLLVKPEISNKVGDATFAFAGSVVTSPVIDYRTLESNVLIKSGDTLAIGGLLQDEMGKSSTKVPVLGDIPLIGYLFQEKVNARTKRNLLVFVTPTLIKQGYGTGLEQQVSGLNHSGEEFADPNGWRSNAKGTIRLVPTSNRQVAADVPKPGVPQAPKQVGYRTNAYRR